MLPPMLHPVRHVRANHSARPSIQQYHGSAGKQTFYFQFSLWLAVCSARDSINPLWGDFRKWNSLCLLTLAIDRDAAGTFCASVILAVRGPSSRVPRLAHEGPVSNESG